MAINNQMKRAKSGDPFIQSSKRKRKESDRNGDCFRHTCMMGISRGIGVSTRSQSVGQAPVVYEVKSHFKRHEKIAKKLHNILNSRKHDASSVLKDATLGDPYIVLYDCSTCGIGSWFESQTTFCKDEVDIIGRFLADGLTQLLRKYEEIGRSYSVLLLIQKTTEPELIKAAISNIPEDFLTDVKFVITDEQCNPQFYRSSDFEDIVRKLEVCMPESYPVCRLKYCTFLSNDTDLRERVIRSLEESFAQRIVDISDKLKCLHSLINDGIPAEVETVMQRFPEVERYELAYGKFRIYVDENQLEKIESEIRKGIQIYSSKKVIFSTSPYNQELVFLTRQGEKLFRKGSEGHGTLGGFASHQQRQVYGVTAGHVAPKGRIMNTVITRSGKQHELELGKTEVSAWNPELDSKLPKSDRGSLLDVALVQITDTRRECDMNFRDLNGKNIEDPKVFDAGLETLKDKEVYKYGATSGLTRGKFVRTIKDKKNECTLYKVSSLNDIPFATHGDSGSLVFTKDDNKAAFLVTGIEQGPTGDTDVVCSPLSENMEWAEEQICAADNGPLSLGGFV